MAFALDILKGLGKNVVLPGAKGIGKMAIGGAGSRMLLGGVVGGTYQALTSDKQNVNQKMTDIFKGVAIGAGIGGLSRAITPALTSSGIKAPLLKAISTGKNLLNLGKTTGKAVLNVGDFVMKHPGIVAGGIGAGVALSIANSGGPHQYSSILKGKTNIQLNSEPDINEVNTSISPTGGMTSGTGIRNRQLMESSYGVVGGMHNSRHG
jgi:hypothetical protein